MKRVLFICIHNSARSQIAEALMRRVCGDSVHVESAGLTPGTLNPLAVEVLREIGIDISQKATRDVFELYKSGARFTHVITVCDEASAERCPVFPGVHQKLNWSLPDPSQFTGTWEEKLAKTRQVRDETERKIQNWCKVHCAVTTTA
jgi:arsenate reductase